LDRKIDFLAWLQVFVSTFLVVVTSLVTETEHEPELQELPLRNKSAGSAAINATEIKTLIITKLL
jgi:hypothetical protein